ncbi:MAG: CRTAC1 family protein [Ignavibacteriales bacterium]|nr:CRTAC1 family protein [Ignavibacteriales bacterium]
MKFYPLFLILNILTFSFNASSQISFVDVTSASGTGLGDGTARGIAWIDFNNDGFHDLFVPTSGSSPNKLYKNNGNGTFSEIAAMVGLNDLTNTITCSWADMDNDGDADLVTTATSGAVRLWKNNRESGIDTTFSNIENEAGITMTGGQMPGWADFNNDGFVDLYIPLSATAANPDALYKNNGDNTFTNVAQLAGVNHQATNILEQATHWCDFNNDRYSDLYIGNLDAGTSSFIHKNNGDGTFTEISDSFQTLNASRGGQWFDFNNDGLWDFCVSPYSGSTAVPIQLFKNNGNGTFTDIASSAGLTSSFISWGVMSADFDNDGFEDIFVSAFSSTTICALYRNNGNETFTDVTAQSGLSNTQALCSASADYDNDGKVDLYLSGPANRLFRNSGDSINHWLNINLVGTQSNKLGIGALIIVKAGNLKMMRAVNSGSGYRSQNMFTAHFGLYEYQYADSVIVRWQNGNLDILTNVSANINR